MKHKIEFSKVIQFYYLTFIYLLVGIGAILVDFFSEKENLVVFGIAILVCFVLLPSTFHFWYLARDHDKSVELNYKEKLCKIHSKKGVRFSFNFDEIQNVFYYRRADFHEDNISALGIENYYYVDFFLKDGSSYRVTCLVLPNVLELPFEVAYVKKLFPLPR